ncbi:MAG: hypothetical protein ACK4RZ_15475 [Paracoccaceae bacterium]
MTNTEVHRFVLPEGCHWNDIREVPANVGAGLQKAMQEIERAEDEAAPRHWRFWLMGELHVARRISRSWRPD